MKFKVGDKVRVRKDLEVYRMYGRYEFDEGMKNYKGKQATIKIASDTFYNLDIDNKIYFWTDEMLEPVAESNAESDENKDESIDNTVETIDKSIDQFTKEDFKFGDIVTVRNGYKYIYIPQKNKFFNSDGIGFMHFNDFNDLLESIGINALDIMKVQRLKRTLGAFYEFETLYERKEEILDEKEKEYLAGVIRPLRDTKVNFIKKVNGALGQQIIIDYVTEFKQEGLYENIELPPFRTDTMYKGMRICKQYTLKELGL